MGRGVVLEGGGEERERRSFPAGGMEVAMEGVGLVVVAEMDRALDMAMDKGEAMEEGREVAMVSRGVSIEIGRVVGMGVDTQVVVEGMGQEPTMVKVMKLAIALALDVSINNLTNRILKLINIAKTLGILFCVLLHYFIGHEWWAVA